MKKLFIWFLFLINLSILMGENPVRLTLGGTEAVFEYTSLLLTRALNARGISSEISYYGNIPTTRLELLMESGEISCFIMGKTEARSEKFLIVDIPMTDNLFGKRILFIPSGRQEDYDNIYTLDDFRTAGKICGMGDAWGDVSIWRHNGLAVTTVGGDWKKLYNMVASESRGIDYLSREAQEIVREYKDYPQLQIEENLVIVYEKDHVLYVSPEMPKLHDILSDALKHAQSAGIIKATADEFYADVFAPPVNLGERRKIHLNLPGE